MKKSFKYLYLLITTGLCGLPNLLFGGTYNLEGTTEVLIYDDFKGNTSKTEYYLWVKARENGDIPKIKLVIPDNVNVSIGNIFREVTTGDRVRVQCLEPKKSQNCTVSQIRVLFKTPIDSQKARSSLWMIVDVNDVQNPYDASYIENKMDINRQWYQESSYRQLDFVKDSDGNGQTDLIRVAIDYDKSVDGCKARKIAKLAVERAKDQGVDTSLFRHRVFILPPLRCGWGGLGHLGCRKHCSSWIASVKRNLIYTHELGHNLGMHHAATDPENDGQENSEYGDRSCPMGRLSQGFFNSAHTFQMGWLSENLGHIKQNITPGDHQIRALSLMPEDNDPSVLTVKHGENHYFLSYRPSSSFDQVASQYRNGVSIHAYDGGKTKTRYLGTFDTDSIFIANDLKIRLLDKTSDHLTVNVNFGGAPTVDAGEDVTQSLPYDKIVLKGSAFDEDGHIIKSEWTDISNPKKSFFWNKWEQEIEIKGLGVGVYKYQFSATDNDGLTATDEVTVRITEKNLNTISDAGPDRTI